MTSFSPNVGHALRVLRRNPAFTITAILVLALATGATTAIFSVIEAVLLRPLPYRNAERLCVLWKTAPARSIEWDWTSYPTIRDWREQNHVFDDLAFVLRPEASRVTLASAGGPEKIQASKVSGNFFETLGVGPLLGRTFTREEAERGDNVAVLSRDFWQGRFGAGRGVLGQHVQLDDRITTIVGVMPPDFQYPDKTAQLWLLVTADSRWATGFQRFRIADAFCALGRIKAGITVDRARAEMNTISLRLARQYPATDAGLGVRVVPLFQQIAGVEVRRALWILGGAVFCVLLIACSNVASLLVARGPARRRELAVRAALGAGRGRLVCQLATENVLLFLAGCLAGMLLAYVGLHALVARLPADLPRSDGISLNATVLAFSFGLCLVTGMVFGLLPAFQIAARDPHAALRESCRGAPAGPGANRARGLLVAAQFALAIVLLTGAGLLLRSFLLLSFVQPGFDAARLLTLSFDLPHQKYKDEARIRAFFEEAIQRIAALPGIQGVAAGSAEFGMFSGQTPNERIVVEGRPFAPDAGRHERDLVSDAYFPVMGIPLSRGRLFSTEDVHDGPQAAVINETMSHRYWPSKNAIGKRFKEVLPGMDRPWLTVVGIVGDVSLERDGSMLPVFYQSIRQWALERMSLVIRTDGDPLNLTAAVRRTVRSIDPGLTGFEIRTVEQRLHELDRPRQFQTELLGLFAALALILAALGLYGLIAYSVEQRTREIGIRVALGATKSNVMGLILRHGLGWAAGGMALGIGVAVAFGRVLSAMLFGITATDPLTLGVVIVVLAVVTAVASSVPARRAMKVDPTVALRHE